MFAAAAALAGLRAARAPVKCITVNAKMGPGPSEAMPATSSTALSTTPVC